MKIGYKIRNLRLRQRMTLKELAKKTGLTTSFLSQLERSIASPSVSSLEKIASALNTKICSLFENEEQKELIFIKRGTAKKSIDRKKNILSETLASGFFNIRMHPQFFTMGINTKLTRGSIPWEGERFIIVLKGKVELLFDSERLTLEEWDSVYFAYTKKLQRISNIGKTEAKLLWISFTPL